ncbi:FAD-binding oxidoreductase [Pseudonocardia benzenivorans]
MSTALDAIPTVFAPGTPGYDAARDGFDLSAIPTPDVAVSARDEADVVTAVRFAAERDLPVVVRTTGHGPVGGAEGGVLIDIRALARVRVDAQRRTAVVGGGATWTPVLAQCAPAGLIPLCGSSPEVGVASYTTGGGLSPLGRRYGWAADRVRRVRLVTPDGEVRDITADSDPELFWAVRGGGCGFGVATELEFDLVRGDVMYGGGLFLPGECAPELLAAFGRVTASAPDALSLSVAFVSFPPVDAVPAPLRGRFVAHLRVAYTGAPVEAERLIAPARRGGTDRRHRAVPADPRVRHDPRRPDHPAARELRRRGAPGMGRRRDRGAARRGRPGDAAHAGNAPPRRRARPPGRGARRRRQS